MHIESADMIMYSRYNQYTLTEKVCDLRDIFFLSFTSTRSILHCSQLYLIKSTRSANFSRLVFSL